jgi:hypothetical protein
LFSCFSFLCLQLLHHSRKSCSTFAPLHHHSSRMLTSPISSTCLLVLGHVQCPLAVIVPQTLTFLSSNVWAYKNCFDRCEEKWVWKLWGQWTSRSSQLFTWTSCGDVTVQTFIVTIVKHIRTCIHI